MSSSGRCPPSMEPQRTSERPGQACVGSRVATGGSHPAGANRLPMPEAKRTLVKSGPELWAEVSDPGALAGHLAPFGEIRITRLAESSLVEWEGERATGRLELEPSGFGTRVVLEARAVTPEPVAPPAAQPAPAPPRAGFFARLFGRRSAPAPVAVAPPPPAPE